MTLRIGKIVVNVTREDEWTKVAFDPDWTYVQPSKATAKRLRRIVEKEVPPEFGNVSVKIKAIKLVRNMAKDATGFPTSLLFAKQLCESWGY